MPLFLLTFKKLHAFFTLEFFECLKFFDYLAINMVFLIRPINLDQKSTFMLFFYPFVELIHMVLAISPWGVENVTKANFFWKSPFLQSWPP